VLCYNKLHTAGPLKREPRTRIIRCPGYYGLTNSFCLVKLNNFSFYFPSVGIVITQLLEKNLEECPQFSDILLEYSS